MSSTARGLIALYSAALDSGDVFDKSVEWYSNGKRGFLHGNTRCYKIARDADLIESEMSYNEAVKRVVCSSCFDKSLMRVLPSLREFTSLLGIRDRVMKGLKNPVRDVMSCYNEMSQIYSYLKQINNYEELSMKEGFYNLHKECARLVAEYGESVRNQIEARKSDIIGYAAKSLLENDSYYELPEYIASSDEAALLSGRSGRGGRSINEIYRKWLDFVVLNKGPVSVVEQAFSSLELTDLTQLSMVDVSKIKDVNTGSLESAVKGAWETARDKLAEELLKRWGESLEKTLNRSDEVLVSINKRRVADNEELGVAIAAYSVVVNSSSGTAVLRCPRIIADWFMKMGYLRGNAGGHVQVIDNLEWVGVDNDTLDTAIKLWDPLNDGPYKGFMDSLIAARNLHV
ncbi:MAG: hypothetical protein ACKOW9_02190 [Candidatus Paceibacterota bacterium]